MQERSEEFKREIKTLEDEWKGLMSKAVGLKKSGKEVGMIIEKLRNAKVALNLCIFDEHAHIEEQERARGMIEEAAREIDTAINSLTEQEKRKFLSQEEFSFEFKKSEFKDIPKTKNWIRIQASEVKKESIDKIEKISGITVEKQENALLIKGEKEALSKAKEIIKHEHSGSY